MTQLLQQIINGLSLGSIYALIALGYTMVYGILKLINFAHGEVFMVGAYTGLYVANALGIDAFEAAAEVFRCIWRYSCWSSRWPRPRCWAC